MPNKGAKKKKQLNLVDRYKIEAYHKMKYSYRKIGREL
jgi:IS30 family transposase